MKPLLLLCASLGFLLALPATAQMRTSLANGAALAPNAPADRPVKMATQGDEMAAALAAFDQHIAPAVKQARATLPQAKRRFLKGLPSGQMFFVTTRITDPNGLLEQVFVRVWQWQGVQIRGEIANELGTVKTYQQGQLINFPESTVLDWTIGHPDGTEEGNYVGKLIEGSNR
jgi:uncharacterized protein YegJ (DUF2314 family)